MSLDHTHSFLHWNGGPKNMLERVREELLAGVGLLTFKFDNIHAFGFNVKLSNYFTGKNAYESAICDHQIRDYR